jgi:hypothetical protein
MFQRKRITPNTDNHRKQQSAKVNKNNAAKNPHKSIDDIDDMDDHINDRAEDVNTGGIDQNNKYYSMIDDNTPPT